jgi:hypothetical protein
MIKTHKFLENLIIISGNNVKSQDNVWVIPTAIGGSSTVAVIIVVVVVAFYVKKVCSSNNGKHMHRYKYQVTFM